MAEAGGDVGFTHAGRADEQHVRRVLQEPAGPDLCEEVGVDAGGGVVVEVAQRRSGGQVREPEPAREATFLGGAHLDRQ